VQTKERSSSSSQQDWVLWMRPQIRKQLIEVVNDALTLTAQEVTIALDRLFKTHQLKQRDWSSLKSSVLNAQAAAEKGGLPPYPVPGRHGHQPGDGFHVTGSSFFSNDY